MPFRTNLLWDEIATAHLSASYINIWLQILHDMREICILAAFSLLQMCQTAVCKADYGWGKTALPISVLSDMGIKDTVNDKNKHPTDLGLWHPGGNQLLLHSCRLLSHQVCTKIAFMGKAKASPTFFSISQTFLTFQLG